jgi:hypothetical protein
MATHHGAIKARARAWLLGLTLTLSLALWGCGSESPERSTIDFTSPAVQANGVIRPNVRCGTGTLWLPMEWGPVPPDTEELAIYIGRYEHKKVDGKRKLVIPFGDLISHISPSLHGIEANTLPVKSRWSAFGTSSCPAEQGEKVVRKGQSILLQLFALDRTRRFRRLSRSLATELTEESLRQDGLASRSASAGELTGETLGTGQIVATYSPKQ